ncbi:MAG: PDC sensor domain-containing protein [Selenomonas artemidis]
MGIKQKLFLMGALMAILVIAICGVGYYRAQDAVTTSTAGEIEALLEVEGESLNGWLIRKEQEAASTASPLAAYDGSDRMNDRELMSVAAGDKDVLDLSYGREDGTFISWSEGDISADIDPRTRKWYTDARSKGAPLFTEVYQDIDSKKMVVTAAAPYKGKDGSFAGAVCADITLDTLAERVKELKYHGVGEGIIVATRAG